MGWVILEIKFHSKKEKYINKKIELVIVWIFSFLYQLKNENSFKFKIKYGDLVKIFVYSEYPWFCRGGHFIRGISAGVFVFEEAASSAHYFNSFRA